MATKQVQSDKKALAKILFMQNMSYKDISEKIDVSSNTLSKWGKEEAWAEQRAANTIDRQSIVNRCLLTIDQMLEKFTNKKDENGNPVEYSLKEYAQITDMIIKMSNTVRSLDTKNSIVEIIDVFSAFSRWLQVQVSVDPSVTADKVKEFVRLQNKYIQEKMAA